MLDFLIGTFVFSFLFIAFIMLIPVLPEIFGMIKSVALLIMGAIGIKVLIGIGIVLGVLLLVFIILGFAAFAQDSYNGDKRYDEYNESVNNILSKFN